MSGPPIHLLGDRAVVLECPPELNARQLALLLETTPGIIDFMPTLGTLTIVYDPLILEPTAVARLLTASLNQPAPLPPPQTHRIAVVYDGPDLAGVAAQCGLSIAQVIALHAGSRHVVATLGFLPGFAYLSGLPAALNLPRRTTPRTSVAAGSVAIANGQTGIYPQASPGGWHLIGRTTARLFDPERSPPALLQPDDIVLFEAV